MPLSQAIQDFFDMSSEPDIDIEGYEADTSICVSESDTMLPSLMTLSDDVFLDPTYWRANPQLRQRFHEHVKTDNVCPTSTATTVRPRTFDPGSTTESESEPDITVTITNPSTVVPSTSTTVRPRTFDPGSTTESESDDPTTPTTATIPLHTFEGDTGSTTESESETDSILEGYVVI
ncbi:hypothetical protein DEU56DRAFT_914241 [Suillus clintonianus]|uniref:uncharacterized protein n=1 Tax=Suillus clintonianus TaxID=1904413 RepID=UPI001B86A7D8|nr:uncharacterized protein DEU56DRAFT_914241 [Suillus clintonianus]KAG2132046.1 hypothetical protein DEU56DRAFT_914241 [Suillus clintonianus]